MLRVAASALVVLGAVWTTFATAADPVDDKRALAAHIDGILTRPEFQTSTFGILIARLRTGEVLYEHGADKLLPPASTAKIVSCGGALATLGKDFRVETRVAAAGTMCADVLHGDLVLVGAGDPNLSQRLARQGLLQKTEILRFADSDHSYATLSDGEVVPGDPLVVLRSLARQVARSGITRVEGDVVVDDGLFAETRDRFAGPVSAVCVNDNIVDVFIAPGEKEGDSPRVRWQPEGIDVNVRSMVKTVAPGRTNHLWVEPDGRRDGALASFVVHGTIATDSGEVLRVGRVAQPAPLAARYFKEALEAASIEVSGGTRHERHGPSFYANYPAVATHVSAPLSEAVKVILKTSQNLHATMLPLLVGAVRGESADRRGGYRAIAEVFERGGLPVDGVVLASGSGGGREDHVTARWLVRLLRFLASRQDFPEFLAALPVGGVDGTLGTHFQSSTLVGRVRAKTGTLLYRGVLSPRWIYSSKALAGYAEPGRQHPAAQWHEHDDKIVFAILMQGTAASDRKQGSERLFRAQEDILRAVLAGPRKP